MTVIEAAKFAARSQAFRWMTRTGAWRGDMLCKALVLATQADPYPLLASIRQRGPLQRSTLGAYVTASHSVASAVLADRRFGVTAPDGPQRDRVDLRAVGQHPFIDPVAESLLSFDPPLHTAIRRVLAPAFTPRAVQRREQRINDVVDEILDELAGAGSFDVIDDFAVRVSTRIIGEILGVRADTDTSAVVTWSREIGASLDGIWNLAQRTRLWQAMGGLETLIKNELEAPAGEGVLSNLAAELGAGRLTGEQATAAAGLVYVAGIDTTANMIGNAVLRALRSPPARGWLMDHPGQAGDFVEEVLRFDTTSHYTVRLAHEQVELSGTRIPRGAMVVVLLGGANHDPDVFTAADRFDPDRTNNRDHLSFAAGAHYCVGAMLARTQISTALDRLFRRFPDLQLNGGVRYRPTRSIRGAANIAVRVRG